MNKSLRFILKSPFRGFSLIELVVIIVLIGIFGTLAMTRTRDGISTIREQIAIDQIINDIDLARSMAFAKNETITIVFSISEESYTVYKGPDNNRTAISEFPNSNNGLISLDNSMIKDVDIKSVNFDDSNELQFLPLGDLKSGGIITLNTKRISMEPVTGKWSIY